MSAELTKHLIDERLLGETLARARASERRRTNFNFHGDMQENPHRFLNVMLRDTYITPHRHLAPPKAESFLILEGRVAFFTFDDDGAIVACDLLGAKTNITAEGSYAQAAAAASSGVPLNFGIDISPGYWHTLVVLSDHAICFEVKPGPYRVSDDKEFAPWAPHEGVAAPEEIRAYQTKLMERVPHL
ncbi:MAG: WbuC family cupin fold metalloprotein [bacterium]|nr:WbuC family cupin fold metalloprotein [bacterium]